MTNAIFLYLMFGAPVVQAAQSETQDAPLPAEAHISAIRLPPLNVFVQAGLRQIQKVEREATRWQRKSRAAGWLPMLALSYDHRNDRGWQVDSQPNAADQLGVDRGRAQVFRIRATWDLSRTVYSGDEVRIAQARLDLAEYRADLARQIATLYQEAIEIAESEQDDAVVIVQLDVVLAQLRALTGLEVPVASALVTRAQAAKSGSDTAARVAHPPTSDAHPLAHSRRTSANPTAPPVEAPPAKTDI
jgi:hypothetical protein